MIHTVSSNDAVLYPKHLSVTGTRRGLTEPQHAQLSTIIALCRVRGFGTLHDGDCIGVDLQAREIAQTHGYRLFSHPSTASTRAFNRLPNGAVISPDEEFEPKSPLTRNRDIVDAGDLLVACPAEMEEIMRSGTWSAVRYAKKMLKRIIFAFPDGSIGQWRAGNEQTQGVREYPEKRATTEVPARTASVSVIPPRGR